jgi:hypothetical protein
MEKRKKRVRKLQSAMEYLMTYGWAILIIAVVLGVLFQLGVFSSSSFALRAPAGSCQVFRPGGPGTNTNVNLMGVCNNQLPKYVGQFNGQNYILIQDSASLNPAQGITISLWFSSSTPSGTSFLLGKAVQYSVEQDASHIHGYIYTTAGSIWPNWNPQALQPNTWHHYVETYNAVTGNLIPYFDGPSYETQTWSGTLVPSTNSLSIGTLWWGAPSLYFNGFIANVQIYNASLTAEDVLTLYNRGIGGAPVQLRSIVGWWPLNGDAKDYSGNNKNGVQIGMSYASQYGK